MNRTAHIAAIAALLLVAPVASMAERNVLVACRVSTWNESGIAKQTAIRTAIARLAGCTAADVTRTPVVWTHQPSGVKVYVLCFWWDHLRYDGGVSAAKLRALRDALNDAGIYVIATDDPQATLAAYGLVAPGGAE